MDRRQAGALVLTALAAAPGLSFGYFRDDWLLLWSALDPDTAPAGSSGVFFRPLALGFWKAATAVGGDHPLAMHLPMFALWFLVAGLVGAVARQLGAGRGAWVAMAIVGSHAGLMELRVWAAASNALLALTLGLAAWLLVLRRRDSWRAGGLGVLLIGVAALARADALAMLVPLPFWWPLRPGWRRGAVAVAVALGAGALGWSLRSAGSSGLDMGALGTALRRTMVPWGPELGPVTSIAASVLALVAVVGLLWRARATPERFGLGVMSGAVLLAQVAVGWAVAGRYLMVVVVGVALLVSLARLPRWATLFVLAYVGLGVATPWWGSSVADMRARARAETSLYRFARTVEVPQPVTIVRPPPMGWHDSPQDAENIISTATRELVPVRFGPEGPGWHYQDGAWATR